MARRPSREHRDGGAARGDTVNTAAFVIWIVGALVGFVAFAWWLVSRLCEVDEQVQDETRSEAIRPAMRQGQF